MSATIFMLGACLVVILWKICKVMDDRYLVEKSNPKYRTPVRIKDGFYYIIPEKEYVESNIRAQVIDATRTIRS